MKWWTKAKKWQDKLRLLIVPAIAAFGAFYFSKEMQKLSGNALWVPLEWRTAVEVLMTIFGTSVFLYAYHRRIAGEEAQEQGIVVTTAQIPPGAADNKGGKKKRAEKTQHVAAIHRHHVHAALWAIMWSLLLAGSLIAFMGLRSRCLIGWNYSAWMQSDEKVAHQHQLSNYNALAGTEGFLDPTTNKLYIPLWFPRDEQNYLDEIASRQGDNDVITYVLNHEPDRLIDWLRSGARTELFFTSALFLLVHILVITTLAFAVAYYFSPLEAIMQLLVLGRLEKSNAAGLATSSRD